VSPDPPPPDRLLLDGDRSVDLRTGALGGVWQDKAWLTTREIELLAWIAARPGVVVRWEDLHTAVWRFAPSVVSRAPYFTWRRLVKKVESDPEHPKNLISHHGDGVMYVPPAAVPITVWGPPGSGRDTVAAAVGGHVAAAPSGRPGEQAIWVGPLPRAEARAFFAGLEDADADVIIDAADALGGRLARAAQALPALGVTGVVRLLLTERLPDAEARVAALREGERRALALLVALGGPVSPALFVRAAQGPPDVLDALAAAGLLRADGAPWRTIAAVVEPVKNAELAHFWAQEPSDAPNAPPEHLPLRRGLERLLPELEPALRARVGLHLVRVLVHAGALQDALVLAEQLVTSAEAPTDRYLLAQRVRILGTLGLHDELEEACIPLLTMCEIAGDLRLTARTTSNLARARHTRGDSAGAVPLLERAREACHRAGDTDGEARTCLTLGTALAALGRWPEAERAVRAALVRSAHNPGLQRESRGQLALQHLMRGDLDAAEAGFAAIADPPEAFATHNYWFVRALLGHTQEALAGLARLTAHARARGAEIDELHHTSLAAMIALTVDDDAAARLALEAEQVRQALGDRSPLPRAVRAVVAARRGDVALATRLSEPEGALGARYDVPLLCLRAEVALALGQPARMLVEQAGQIARRQHADPRALYVGWAGLWGRVE
jgi:hypothetical protein